MIQEVCCIVSVGELGLAAGTRLGCGLVVQLLPGLSERLCFRSIQPSMRMAWAICCVTPARVAVATALRVTDVRENCSPSLSG